VLDLLGLPLPEEGVESVVGTFDAQNQLDELLVLYRTRHEEFYPRPEALTYVLRDCLDLPPTFPANDAAARGLVWRVYTLEGQAMEVAVVHHNPAVSAIVRFKARKAEPRPETAALLPRDFGGISLDRSFEQDRRRVALHQRGNRLTVEAPAGLEQVTAPITALAPSRLVLERAPTHDVLTRLTLYYNVRKKGHYPLAQLAGPLWAAGGTARLLGGDGANPLLLAWEDARTCCVLRLPNRKDEEVSLEVYSRSKDRQTQDPPGVWVEHLDVDFAARAEAVRAHDRAERRARLEAGKPLAFVPRELERVKLGMSRAEVQRVLPPDFKALKRTVGSDLLVTLTGDAPRNAPVVARELVVRFDAAGRVVEVRVRVNGNGVAKLVAGLEKQAGAPEKGPAPWVQAWADLPPRRPAPVLRRWQDDVTLLTCQQDGVGAELCLRACPADHEDGTPLPPLAYLPRGPEGCVLGTARDALLREWKVATTTLVEGAVVLAPKAGSPYDALLVWFDNDRVERVVARHRSAGSLDAAHAGRAVVDAWSLEGRTLGYPWRQDLAEERVVQGWTTQDDRTRVRLFWQQRDDGTRGVFTEWREVARP
jgi:hypothetical protein